MFFPFAQKIRRFVWKMNELRMKHLTMGNMTHIFIIVINMVTPLSMLQVINASWQREDVIPDESILVQRRDPDAYPGNFLSDEYLRENTNLSRVAIRSQHSIQEPTAS